MERFSIAIAVLAVVMEAFFLPGCGGSSSSGGGGTTSSSTVTVNGVANLGVVKGGVVSAYRLDGGSKGTLLDRYSGTGPDGTFRLRITNYQGPMLLELAPDANNSATFLDEYSGTMKTLADRVRSVAPAVTADQYANITPLTEMAAAGALQKLAAGTDPVQGVAESLAQVGTAFLGGGDPLTLVPDDLSQVSSKGSADYAGVLAGIAGLAATRGKSIAALSSDFYGQLFPSSGKAGALRTRDVQDLYTHMTGAPVKGAIRRRASAAKPLGSANIAEAHQGRFDYVSLALTAGGKQLEDGTVDLYTTNAGFSPRDLYTDGTWSAPAKSRVTFDTYTFSADGRWSLNRVASAVATPEHQGVFSADGQMVAGVLTDNYSVRDQRFLVGVRHATSPALRSGEWQWVVLEYQTGGSLVTFSGNLSLTAATVGSGSFSGILRSSNSAAATTFNGSIGRDSYGFVFRPSTAGGVVPSSFAFVPSEDGDKAIVWFADGTVWGLGVALRRNTTRHQFVGRSFHYAELAASVPRSTSGMVRILAGKGLFSGRDFTTAPQPKKRNIAFSLMMKAADKQGMRAVSLSRAGEAARTGYIAPDGMAIVAEDPGKGIRLLLRQ